jgi:hypothetical protein
MALPTAGRRYQTTLMLSLTTLPTNDPLVFLPGHPSCPSSHISFPAFHKTFDNILVSLMGNPNPVV